ncbi:hypothetical protein VTJ83DRAFT_3304 [Remersonia thermophila]|uniref:Purine permease n=1 Tax=Remersonia thermophila TaxID=72144 RepID=A0ABR4DDM9_9PEZI
MIPSPGGPRTAVMDEDDMSSPTLPDPAPAPAPARRRGLAARLGRLRRIFLTKEGLIGSYDYAFLFRPNLPFMKPPDRPPPFFGLNDRVPVLLAVFLGFQHALAMLAGIITPPILLANAVHFDAAQTQYLVSTALIVSGLLSCVQIARFRIPRTRYFIGTGLVSVVGISFAIIPVAEGAFSQMYANGFCPTATARSDVDGAVTTTKLPCPDAYGAVLGTAALCALFEIGLAFVPPRVLLRLLPPIVTGPTVLLIGVNLIATGFRSWAGGSGACFGASPSDPVFARCPDVTAPHALPWGSPEYLGLGFCVFVTIVLCERFGSPLMKSTSVAVGLLVGCVVAAACGYFDRSGIDAAPAVSFVWTHTFKLSLYGPLVLPLLAVFAICACEAVGDITATCDVSRLEVSGEMYETRIQGGVLADGVNGVLAALATITPMTTFAQNNGVIALTRCANRSAGYCCCMFLILAGIFTKTAAALVAIPAPVLGGMTTFLFASVAVSGMAILSSTPSAGKSCPHRKPPQSSLSSRRTRFIITASLALGYGATLVPNYFDRVFGHTDNESLRGFEDAIALIMETGFAVTALTAGILNAFLPPDVDEGCATAEQEVLMTWEGLDWEMAKTKISRWEWLLKG